MSFTNLQIWKKWREKEWALFKHLEKLKQFKKLISLKEIIIIIIIITEHNLNPLSTNFSLPYPLKPPVFWCFQGAQKWNIGWKWVKHIQNAKYTSKDKNLFPIHQNRITGKKSFQIIFIFDWFHCIVAELYS